MYPSNRRPHKPIPIILHHLVDIVFVEKMASLFPQNDEFNNGLWMLVQYTTEYKYIRIFIVYVWIHSYNFLFH